MICHITCYAGCLRYDAADYFADRCCHRCYAILRRCLLLDVLPDFFEMLIAAYAACHALMLRQPLMRFR